MALSMRPMCADVAHSLLKMYPVEPDLQSVMMFIVEEPERRQIFSWQHAEHNASDWMRAWGYRDAKVTPAGADGGVDVQASGAMAQVKFEAKQVGRPQLQLLVGARGRAVDSELLFFTGAGYSPLALEYAAEMDIALFQYSLDGRMTAINAPARTVSSKAQTIGSKTSAKDEKEEGGDGCAGIGALIIAMILFAIAVGLGSISWVPVWVMTVPGLIGLLFAAVGISLIRDASRQRKESSSKHQ